MASRKRLVLSATMQFALYWEDDRFLRLGSLACAVGHVTKRADGTFQAYGFDTQSNETTLETVDMGVFANIAKAHEVVELAALDWLAKLSVIPHDC